MVWEKFRRGFMCACALLLFGSAAHVLEIEQDAVYVRVIDTGPGPACVVRLDFADRAILFTGDIVGRYVSDRPDALIAAEKFMVENASRVAIKSHVLITPHHGADNGSATEFIQTVNPTWAVFRSR